MTDFGPLEPLLQDPTVMEIMVNRYDQIYVERRGKLEQVADTFRDEAHLMQIVMDGLVTPLGRKLDESNPMVDLRFPDGSRCHVVIPPIARHGISIVVRKLPAHLLTGEDLLRFGALNQTMLDFLRDCVEKRLNIAVSGGTGSGKTTVLNIMCGFIPDDERIVTVENEIELRFDKPHLVVLETRPANVEGRGEINAQQLMISSMKMRPDRIIMGEARGGEVVELIQAINTGFDGALFSMHAGSPRDALIRLEVMATMGMPQIPLLSIRQQLATGVDLIVHSERLMTGVRRLVKITQVTGIQDGIITTQDIFEFVQTGMQDGKIIGDFRQVGELV
ncbi:MAG TPA: CpaF family protein [Phototrophicaceae bacterium]|jgi:pilus assembly protein CpaF|nr:CpaF family protein [Phototrophicaceae bacterium]